jgi:hypothetical protein
MINHTSPQNGIRPVAIRAGSYPIGSPRSRRIVKALLQLPQFRPFSPSSDNLYAVHVLTGAHVYPVESVHDLGLLLIRFSGSMPGAEVSGDQYLRLQICEAAGHLGRCPEHGVGQAGEAARALLADLSQKFDLK